HRVVLLAVSTLTVAFGACTGGRDSAPPPAPASTSTPHTTPHTTIATTPATTTTSPATTAAVAGPSLITAPTTAAPVPIQERPDTTIRVGVFAAEGGDGLGDDDDDPTSRYPPFTAIDISPLPPAITDDQGRND